MEEFCGKYAMLEVGEGVINRDPILRNVNAVTLKPYRPKGISSYG